MRENSHRRSAVWACMIALLGVCLTGGYFVFSPTLGVNVLGQEPLLEQVRSEVSAHLRSEEGSSVYWWNKPTPAWVELVIEPSMPTEQVISLTESQPAFATWTVLDKCSSTVLWCAARSTEQGTTLLATWSYENFADGTMPLIFRVSEN